MALEQEIHPAAEGRHGGSFDILGAHTLDSGGRSGLCFPAIVGDGNGRAAARRHVFMKMVYLP